ncbi:hypothetical protein PCANC_04418 [Puccinia coronata f. sp. avenae]|uniref:Uncharacterized protein n=1 Tax=Puccinia coronata f. sp. avenae TaxID=200324 RepID=A0A2N5T930_9BASI|nr:hypothetical protein PCANC_04418 [Puccinia coronata f. sp. avenae]
MDHSNQSNYEYTEVSTYTKVETVAHKGSVSSTSSTKTTHTKCTVSPLLGRSVPRYKPNSTARAHDSTPSTEVSKDVINPKSPHFSGLDTVRMTSKTSRRKVTFAEIGNKPVAKAVQPCTEKPKAKDVEPKNRAQKVPAAEPPRKATQKVAVEPRLTTAAKMTTKIVKLCEIMVPHSETLVTCLGDTSGAKAVGKGTEVTSSLCRCRLISNLRSAGGKVTENLRLLTLRACNCQVESKVLILPSTHTGGIVCNYKVTVTEASSGDSYFEIRPDDSVGRSPDAGSKLSFIGSRTSGAHVEVPNDIGRHNRVVGGAPGAPGMQYTTEGSKFIPGRAAGEKARGITDTLSTTGRRNRIKFLSVSSSSTTIQSLTDLGQEYSYPTEVENCVVTGDTLDKGMLSRAAMFKDTPFPMGFSSTSDNQARSDSLKPARSAALYPPGSPCCEVVGAREASTLLSGYKIICILVGTCAAMPLLYKFAMQDFQDQVDAAAAVRLLKSELETEAEKTKVTGSTTAPILFNSMRVSMEAMCRNLEKQTLALQAMVVETRKSRESMERLSAHVEASTTQTTELLHMLRYSMGSSGSVDLSSNSGTPGQSTSKSPTRDRYVLGTKIVTKYDVVACVLFRLIMLAWSQDRARGEPRVNSGINMSLTYPTLKRVVKPMANSKFKSSITGHTDPEVPIPEKSDRGTRSVLNRLSDSTPDTQAQITVADIRDICNDPHCTQLMSATMEVAFRIYTVRGVLCPAVRAYCGSLGRYPRFKEEGDLAVDLDPEPLTRASRDADFNRKVRDLKPGPSESYIREFLELGPAETM